MLDDTLEGLRAAALGSTDASGYFPAMYARVTRRVMDRAGRGEFDDDERMARFVRGFAARYFVARSAPASACRCWSAAFDVAGDQALLIVQQLLLGIKAHVNYDLPLTVVELAADGTALASIKPDFDAVNGVLAETYQELLGDLDRVTRWVGRVAAMGGGHLFNFSLVVARDQAWRSAEVLQRTEPVARAAEIVHLDGVVTALSGLVGHPTVPFRWLVPLARRLETRDPVAVTRRLLGPLA